MKGTELRAIRKGFGLTQGQLAEKLGLSQGFIGEMERGEKAIEQRTVILLATLRDQSYEEVDEHGFTVEYADRVNGWNVIFTNAGWRAMFGNRQVVLHGHFRRKRDADRWAAALERAARPRMQRNLHAIVNAAIERGGAA